MAMEESPGEPGPLGTNLTGDVRERAEAHAEGSALSIALAAAREIYRFLCARVSMAVGVFLFVTSLYAKSHYLGAYVGEYDEGIIVNGANAILLGDFPYRNFYTNYPPGVFLTLAAIWKISGVSLAGYRLFGAVIHLALGIVAGRLAGRVAGSRHRFSWLACGLVSVWTIHLGVVPYAWIAALAFLGLALDRILWAIDTPSRRRFVIAGVAYGLVSCFRHDMFVHFTWVMVLVLLVPNRYWTRLGATKPSRTRIVEFLAGAAIPILLVWGPIAVIAGIPLILRDTVIDQARYVLPGRVLPFPPLFQTNPGDHLPQFAVSMFAQAVFLTLIGPLLALLHLFGKRPNRTAIFFLFPAAVG
ncbi:MAG: hypothetical protein ABW133_23780, partial [Polyangiaceae bacterium]